MIDITITYEILNDGSSSYGVYVGYRGFVATLLLPTIGRPEAYDLARSLKKTIEDNTDETAVIHDRGQPLDNRD